MSFNSINRATILGRLGRTPKIKTMTDGNRTSTFSVATNTSWVDKSGEKKELTDWHNIVVFNEPTVKFIESYVKKGSRVYIEGKIKTRKWTDKMGNNKYATEIIVSGLDSRIILLDSLPSNSTTQPDDYDNPDTQEIKIPSSYDNPDTQEIDDPIPF